ncbi:MAG: hypothetical protein HO274_00545 [Ferrovum myxofaciens]|jgi:hypothetical protein|uniref:hypothetical protein n=1 Tax=Ferrovum myxofaciens TaxID=416213 RepID=UPI0023566AC1|nr:hypothetical protein [Ferrovum myxofaciens]QKE39988.1 MAG: hypothetical protein HO274_00545 [Ferrovum myxofaciens]
MMVPQENKGGTGADDNSPGELDLTLIIQPLLDQGRSLKEIAVALRKTAYLVEMMAKIHGDFQ